MLRLHRPRGLGLWAAIENLGPGADLDGRCNQVNQGPSCSWLYGIEACCEKAVADGFPNHVQCN